MAEKVQPRRERRRTELHHQEQERKDDADKRDDRGADRQQRRLGLIGRDREANRNPGDQHSEGCRRQDIDELD